MPAPEQLIRFDRLRERLLHAGIASRHVRRTLTELGEHFDDAVRDGRAKGLTAAAAEISAWERLGNEDEIVQGVLDRPELRSLPARYPRAISAVGPALLWVTVTIGSGFLVAGISTALQMTGTGIIPAPRTSIEPLWLQNLMNTVLFVYMRILPIAIGAWMAAVFARLHVRSWAFIGAALVSLLSAFSTFSIVFPQVIGEGGELNVGFGAKLEELPTVLMLAAVNIALILSAYWLAHRRLKT